MKKIIWMLLFAFAFLFVAENVSEARCGRQHRLRTWLKNHRPFHRG